MSALTVKFNKPHLMSYWYFTLNHFVNKTIAAWNRIWRFFVECFLLDELTGLAVCCLTPFHYVINNPQYFLQWMFVVCVTALMLCSVLLDHNVVCKDHNPCTLLHWFLQLLHLHCVSKNSIAVFLNTSIKNQPIMIIFDMPVRSIN